MFTPANYRLTDTAAIRSLCDRHGFANLITHSAAETFVTHVPLLVDVTDDGRFEVIGHVARANPHAAALEAGQPTVAVFLGPHAYISPVWYRHDPRVPTWNYAAVHFHGVPVAFTRLADAAACVTRLADKYEALANPDRPWRFDASHPDSVRELRAILAFRMPAEAVYAKHKFNQNQPAASRRSVIAALEASADPLERGVADIMRGHLGGEHRE
jgi:transcriptional regulator